MMQRITHEIPPVYDKNSKILILGSLPSVKSREVNFY
ncbi:MAG: DNA-deoxyinosine glycosylase, partial [Christensenellaceae bacterium]